MWGGEGDQDEKRISSAWRRWERAIAFWEASWEGDGVGGFFLGLFGLGGRGGGGEESGIGVGIGIGIWVKDLRR